MDITGYKKTVLATTDKVQVIFMLYEGALNHMKIAKKKIECGDITSKGKHFSKATAIITELSNVLDMEKGGDISRNLRSLYEYVLNRLLHANLNNDTEALEDSERVLETLKSGWKEMMEGMKQKQTQEVRMGA
ncbi:MAG: flagellar export chaperone FliS [Nitrospiraceae bacterium]|nr:MAG: flagellar export chaperone FliS [Nitrospiraceae bacterium]